MTLSETEIKILKILKEFSFITKSELLSKIGTVNGTIGAVKSLAEKGYITIVHPLGEVSYAITQNGERYLKSLENSNLKE
ncbi:MAG: hypothetical protein QXF15_01930 [Candidatus Aenigmatarchaeota archaeon]|nr:hypothetical protein [Candidatus Aenigmarchaeota archaeon]